MVAEGYNIREVVIGHYKSTNINKNGFTAYLDFATLEEALNMKHTYDLDGVEVRLWHKGIQTCAICSKRGHRAFGHDAWLEAIDKATHRRAAYRRRRTQRRQGN